MIFSGSDEVSGEDLDEARSSRDRAEQELDKVYHAIPQWVHRLYPNIPLDEKVRKGFDYQQKQWTETYLAEVWRHEETREFVSYLLKKYNLDRFTEYSNFLLSKAERKHLLSKEEK